MDLFLYIWSNNTGERKNYELLQFWLWYALYGGGAAVYPSFQPLPIVQPQVHQPVIKQVDAEQKEQKEQNSVNKDLLWAGLTCLAVAGTYLLTRGHYKAKLPSNVSSRVSQFSHTAGQAAAGTHTAGEAAKPIHQAVTDFTTRYKPLSGIEGVPKDIKPTITQVGSRTRADYTAVVDGQQIRETLIFNADNKPVSRFVERVNADGIKKREAFRLNTNGEPELVQRSSRQITKKPELNVQTETRQIENLTVNELPNDLPDAIHIDANSNVRSVQFLRRRDTRTGKLLDQHSSRCYINDNGDMVGGFSTERIYGRDSNGNLRAVFSQNPKKLFMGKDYSLAILDENGRIVSERTANLIDRSLINRGHIDYRPGDKPGHTLTDEETALFRNIQEYYASLLKK